MNVACNIRFAKVQHGQQINKKERKKRTVSQAGWQAGVAFARVSLIEGDKRGRGGGVCGRWAAAAG